mgnify:CR=1 FL=1
MGSSRIMRRVMISLGAAVVLLLLPLIFALGVATGVLGGIVVSVVIVVAVLAPVLNEKQRADRNRKATQVSAATPTTEQIANELGVPMVSSVRPPDKAVEVIVKLTEGGCPLMREVGDVFRVSAGGRLSSPLCSPSAAAVQRLIREQGVESGTTERCVCPGGPHELTFALESA